MRGTPATPRVAEQVVWTLARQCRPGDVVAVGLGTPIAAAAVLLARRLLVPNLTILMGGRLGPEISNIAHAFSETAVDAKRLGDALPMTEIIDMIQRGAITLQFISPAEIDELGNVNASVVRTRDGLQRLPGGIALADVAVCVGRLIAYRTTHERRFLRRRVTFVTGRGHGDDGSWRRRNRVSSSGVVRAVTAAACIEWTPSPRLLSIHRECREEAVLSECEFDLGAGPFSETEPPPRDAVDLLRMEIDPLGLCGLEVREERDSAEDRLTSYLDGLRSEGVRP
jgi:glutaconate CoA-transferase, subunit B